jgi:hypothetical protein
MRARKKQLLISDQLDKNMGAAAIKLTLDDLRDTDSAASKIKMQGARYPEKLEEITGR